jgi:hypothetical protein
MALTIIGGPQAVWPDRPAQALPSYDARNAALKQFRRFLSTLMFQRSGPIADDTATSIPFRVPIENIHIYQPDDIKMAKMPGFGIVPSLGVTEAFGLGPNDPEEDSFDVWSPGTVLVVTGDYQENFTLEVWGSKQAERRALVAGVKAAMMVSQDSSALRLRLTEYYDRAASFQILDTIYVDGDEVARNRRRALITIQLQVSEVALINANRLRPSFDLCVSDPSTLAPGTCDPIDSGCACSC